MPEAATTTTASAPSGEIPPHTPNKRKSFLQRYGRIAALLSAGAVAQEGCEKTGFKSYVNVPGGVCQVIKASVSSVFSPSGGSNQLDRRISPPAADKYTFDAATGVLDLQEPPQGYDTVLYWKDGTNPPDPNIGHVVVRGTPKYDLGIGATGIEVMWQSQDRKNPTGTKSVSIK